MKKQGFTLMELLIVIAIIVVLVAISIPVFSANLEKSREAVDLANLRAAYAELNNIVSSGEIKTGGKFEKTSDTLKTYVRCKSTKSGWQTSGLKKNGYGQAFIGGAYCGGPSSNKPYVRVRYVISTGAFEYNLEASIGKTARTFN